MANIDEFKSFVRKNPKLTKYINDGSMSWQKFYELYDIYGEDNEVWKQYLEEKKVANLSATSFSLADTINFIKNIDLDSIQDGINSIQRVVGVFSDLTGKSKPQTKTEYKPRPLYKHFED